MPICPVCQTSLARPGEACPRRDGGHGVLEEALRRHPKDRLLGQLVGGRFALISVLGAGMMGTVYEGLQLDLERRCAIKVLKPELVRDEKQRKRFQREAEVIARLNHPNLVALYDFGSEGVSYISMEFVAGRPLEETRGDDGGSGPNYAGVDQRTTLHLLNQLLSALAEAHRHNVVHRDLKPENIILCARRDDPYHIKILDFGLAKLLEEGEHQTVLTATGEILGTPLYMSPEQATGMHPISHASDVYSVGAMAFELLTGRPPFDAPTPLATMMQHANLPVPAMRARAGIEISSAMEAFVRCCLSKAPSERYPSALEALGAFQQTPEMAGFQAPRVSAVSSAVALEDDEADTPVDPLPPIPQQGSERKATPRARFSIIGKPPGSLKR